MNGGLFGFTDEQWSLLHDIDEELEGRWISPAVETVGSAVAGDIDTDDEDDEEVSECDEEFG
ncbi:hypothetical protein GCM10020331_091570 [Ectobacillus funiculus]